MSPRFHSSIHHPSWLPLHGGVGGVRGRQCSDSVALLALHFAVFSAVVTGTMMAIACGLCGWLAAVAWRIYDASRARGLVNG